MTSTDDVPQNLDPVPQDESSVSKPNNKRSRVPYVLPRGLNVASLNVSSIPQPEIVAAIREERALRDAIEALKQKSRQLSLEKQAEVGRAVVDVDRKVSQLDDRLDTLTAERATIARKLDEVRFKQATLATARDTIVSAEHQRDAVGEELPSLRRALDEARKRLQTLEEEQKRLNSAVKAMTVGQAEAALAQIQATIAALPKGKAPTATLLRQKTNAEQSKRDAVAAHDIADKVSKEQRKVQQAENDIVKRVAARDAAEQQRKQALATLGQAGAYRTEFASLRQQQAALQKDIDALLKQRRASHKPKSSAVTSISTTLTETHAERNAKEEALRLVQQQIPCHVFRFPAELRKHLIGPGGGVKRDLESDFGVAVQLDESLAYIVGGPMETAQCVEAMRAIVLDAQARSHRETIHIDGTLRPVIIGSNGATIERVQSVSGAKVHLAGDNVIVTGTVEEVESAVALLRDIIDRNARATVPFDISMLDTIIGKGGAAIRRTMEETGVQNIHVDRKSCNIVITGAHDAVAAAAEAYHKLLDALQRNVATVACDEEGRMAVIGKGGSVVRGIEGATGASIDVRKGSVFISAPSEDGLREAVAKVREAMDRRGADKVPLDGMAIAVLSNPSDDSDELMLQRLKRVHNLSAATIVRSESCVALRGAPEAVAKAKEELLEWLSNATKDTDTLTVPLPLAKLAQNVAARKGGAVSRDESGSIRVGGSREVRAACAAAVAALCEEYAPYIAEVSVPRARIGNVIGSRGGTIKSVTEATHTNIAVDRDNERVMIVSERKNADDLAAAVAQVTAARDGKRGDAGGQRRFADAAVDVNTKTDGDATTVSA